MGTEASEPIPVRYYTTSLFEPIKRLCDFVKVWKPQATRATSICLTVFIVTVIDYTTASYRPREHLVVATYSNHGEKAANVSNNDEDILPYSK